MFLRSLYLHHFRSYEEAHFSFNPGINIIHGENAQGKTNLLEAIHFLVTGSSFRNAQSTDLIKHQCSNSFLEAHFIKRGIDQTLKVAFSGKERKIIHNQTLYSSSNSLLGLLQGVVITPDDVALIKGSPQLRRHFLDIHIGQYAPLYVHHLTRYHRAMRQRNTLLRLRTLLSIESWEYEMANAAGYLTLQRKQAIEELGVKCEELHQTLSGKQEKLALHYKSQAPISKSGSMDDYRNFYLEQFAKHRRREMELGATVSGPQKDDLSLTINENDARFFASEGQQRSCIAALRLAEWFRLREQTEEPPLLLIDDIGTSLDERRKERLLSQLSGLGQVFISSTAPLLLDGQEESLSIEIFKQE